MSSDDKTTLRTIREASQILGVHRVTLYRWMREGKLKAYRIGTKSIRISDAELAKVMQEWSPETTHNHNN